MIFATDFGVRSDDGMDQSDAIERALSSQQDIYLPPGRYKVGKPIRVLSGSRLMGAGWGATTIYDDVGSHSFFTSTDPVSIEIGRLTIEGNHPTGAGGNTIDDGINFFAATPAKGISIHNCRLRNLTGRGIVLVRHCSDVWIHDNVFENCSVGVFLFGGTRHGMITRNLVRGCRIGGIVLDDATNHGETGVTAFTPRYHSITGNHVTRCGYDPVQTGFGIGVSASDNVSITDNIVDRIGSPGIVRSPGIIANSGQDDLFPMRNLTVSGNRVSECAGAGIFLEAVQQFVVTGNILVDNNMWDSETSHERAEIVVRPHTRTGTLPRAGLISANMITANDNLLYGSTVGISVSKNAPSQDITVENNAIINLAPVT